MYEHKGIAEGLAAFGRGGDSMLMHVHPAEVEALHSMAPGRCVIYSAFGSKYIVCISSWSNWET